MKQNKGRQEFIDNDALWRRLGVKKRNRFACIESFQMARQCSGLVAINRQGLTTTKSSSRNAGVNIMANWSEEEVERTLEEIKKRAITDPEFRTLALSDANAAVSKVNPKPLPEGYQVKFVDNSGPVKSFVLPDPVENIEELSDAELEAVAGGVSRTNTGNANNL